jgi:exodeoxyribonuclease VII small subunit
MEMSFEDRLTELEKIVEKLENGHMSLDESLGLFETGIRLVKECEQNLKNAQQRIEKLVEENNEIKSEKFEMLDLT